MMGIKPRRSALFMPGGNARAIEKARSLATDAVILDLEDSVAPNAKVEARLAVCATVKSGGFGSREVVIRINAWDTPWGMDDLTAAIAARPHAILLPKISAPADIVQAGEAVKQGVRLWGMIETCQAILSIDALGAASGNHGLDVWVVGPNDLIKQMRCAAVEDRSPILPALTLAVIAARSHGLSILDGVWTDITNLSGLERECTQGRDLGFDGKSLIHPSHLDVTNRAFSPTLASVSWARTVVAAYQAPENIHAGVIRLEGKMVERLHLEEAKRVVAIAEAIGGEALGQRFLPEALRTF
jgi:citrate lyase subunit beta/citryl-CoA lyase